MSNDKPSNQPSNNGRKRPGSQNARPGNSAARNGVGKPAPQRGQRPGQPAAKPGSKSGAKQGAKKGVGAAAGARKRPNPNAGKNGQRRPRTASQGNITARARKKVKWRDKAVIRKAVATGAAVMAVALIVPLVAFFAAYSVTKVPEPEELVNNQISYIMASDNETELGRIVPPEGNRQNVKIEQIPEHVRNAVLAAEDRAFYKNPGFSISGFARAAVGQVLGRSGAGGGSTITQQYVKNALVGDERSITRKAKELVISAKMAREWSKDEILEAYLNTIYFGRNAYGISAAAKAYFGKDVSELSPEEGAVIAAVIQAPSALDPWTNRERAEQRWNYVMDGMEQIGAIDHSTRINARYPEVQDPNAAAPQAQADGPNGLIKTQVINELEAAGITEEQVNTGGLRITTTIDSNMQNAAVEQSHQLMEGQQEGLRGAVVSVDPKNGAIRSWYGGDDPVGFDFANAGLQTGSTFKIIALAAYLDQGGSIYDQFDSSPVTTGGTRVTNVNNESCGNCTAAQALKMSLNTSYIRVTRALKNGAQDVADMAHRLGVAEELPGLGKTLSENGGAPFEGITLGMYQTRPLDMASVLATLSNKGVYHRPHFVQKVENSNGDVLLDNTDMKGDQVISEEVANGVLTAMAPIAAYSNGNSLAGGRPSAAKTGTVQLGDTGNNKDAWMIGSTPQLSTAVWIGAADGGPIFNPYGGVMYGSGLPAQIWRTTMNRSLENTPVESFGSNTGNTTNGNAYAGSSSSTSGGGQGQATQTQAPEQTPAPAPAVPAGPAPGPAPAPGEPPAGQPPTIEDFFNGLISP